MNNEGKTQDFDIVMGTDLSSPTVRNLNIEKNGQFNVVDYDKVNVGINDQLIMNTLVDDLYIHKPLLNANPTYINSGKYSCFCLQGIFLTSPKISYTTIKDFFLDTIRIFDLTKIANHYISTILLTNADLNWFVNSEIHSLVGLYSLKPKIAFDKLYYEYIKDSTKHPIIFDTNHSSISNDINLTKSKLDFLSLLFFIYSLTSNNSGINKTITLSNIQVNSNKDAFQNESREILNPFPLFFEACHSLNYTLVIQ